MVSIDRLAMSGFRYLLHTLAIVSFKHFVIGAAPGSPLHFDLDNNSKPVAESGFISSLHLRWREGSSSTRIKLKPNKLNPSL